MQENGKPLADAKGEIAYGNGYFDWYVVVFPSCNSCDQSSLLTERGLPLLQVRRRGPPLVRRHDPLCHAWPPQHRHQAARRRLLDSRLLELRES